MATGGCFNCCLILEKPSLMFFKLFSRLDPFEGRTRGSTTSWFAWIAVKSKFVPPASRVITMRLSLSYFTIPRNYKLQITNYKLQITNYRLQITGTGYKLQVMGCR